MKKFLSLFLIFIFITSFTSCTQTADNKKNLTPITICLDWTPNTNHTGLYVAKEKGYYEEAGLDVTIVQPPEDGASLMCASGQADFAIDFQDYLAPVFASDNPMNVTAVAAVLNHNTSGIISRKGEGLNRPKGLEGKTYSTWNLPVEQAMIKNVMQSDGGDFSKVTLVPNNISNEALALKAKQTDAIWIYYAWSGINAEISGVEFDYWNFADINPVFDYYTPVIIANNDFLNKNPDVSKKFLAATKKGYEYAISNPEKAADILIKSDETGSLKDSRNLVVASQKWIADKYIDDAPSWGYIDSQRWNDFYTWLWENKLITKEIPQNFGFTNKFLS